MKQFLTLLFLSNALLTGVSSNATTRVWQPNNTIHTPLQKNLNDGALFSVFTASGDILKSQLWSVADASSPLLLELPLPDGSFKTFLVSASGTMDEALAKKYPSIKTFSARAIDNPAMNAKLDYTEKGFHAMIFEGSKVILIDPQHVGNTLAYVVYYKNDFRQPFNQRMTCDVQNADDGLNANALQLTPSGLPDLQFKSNGLQRRTYRLAVSCTREYATAVDGPNPTKAGVLSAIITSVNRVNGVYENEFSVTLSLIGNTDALIFLPGDATSPFIGFNSNSSSLISKNQTVTDDVIGPANYDIGHVFSTGGGGLASAGVCVNNNNARGVTGNSNPVGDPFDIDYVAHEMGHQFSASHTFNASTGSCSGNGSIFSAYEPGSGTTIMAYAGICNVNDLQPHSDPYFHARSLEQISTYITTGSASLCPVMTPTGNDTPVVASFSASYTIPSLTPFELTAPAVSDAQSDVPLTYCWEQWNRGDFQKSFVTTRLSGPIFRSFLPSLSPTRVFPKIDTLVDGVTNYLGEKLPDTSRYLTFKLTVRDQLNNLGAFTFPTDTVHLDVIHTGVPFTVTSQGSGTNWISGNIKTVTWNVANTNNPPVNAATVDIYLSTDGGLTFPVLLYGNAPNDGSQDILVPNNIPSTNKARIKVKGSNNVFFNISNANFTLTFDPNSIKNVSPFAASIHVYPVPVSEQLHIDISMAGKYPSALINTLGQTIWKGTLEGASTIPVNEFSKGIYFLKITNGQSVEAITKQVVIQ